MNWYWNQSVRDYFNFDCIVILITNNHSTFRMDARPPGIPFNSSIWAACVALCYVGFSENPKLSNVELG